MYMFRPAVQINWYKTSLTLSTLARPGEGGHGRHGFDWGAKKNPQQIVIPNRLSSTATIIIDESRWCLWIPQWTALVVAPAYFATP